MPRPNPPRDCRGRCPAHDGETIAFETVTQPVGQAVAYTVEIERFKATVGGRSVTTDPRVERQTAEWFTETDAAPESGSTRGSTPGPVGQGSTQGAGAAAEG